MNLSPSQNRTLLRNEQLKALGVPWFDDNPLGWQELAAPTGSTRSAWDLLTVTVLNPGSSLNTAVNQAAFAALGQPFVPSPEATFYADVVGKLELNIDKKQVPGKNAAKLTVVNLAADDITTLLYLLTPEDLLNFVNLIPSKVMTVTRQDLLAAATKNGAILESAIANGQAVTVKPPVVPIVQLTHPAIQISGRNKFVLKSMGLVQPPRDGRPPMVSLVWMPQEDYVLAQTVVTTATTQGLNYTPNSKATSTSSKAVSPATVPAANRPAL
jgi:hypothetical protein